MSVTQCDLLWANRIKSKLLMCKPEVLKGPVSKAEKNFSFELNQLGEKHKQKK